MVPWLPDFVYEQLPAVYVSCSLLVLLLLDPSSWSALSAASFALAAGITWVRRRRFRRQAII